MTLRVDVHQHMLPAYRDALLAAGITARGRELPEWDVDAAVELMAGAEITSAVLSVSAPGVSFVDDPAWLADLRSFYFDTALFPRLVEDR